MSTTWAALTTTPISQRVVAQTGQTELNIEEWHRLGASSKKLAGSEACLALVQRRARVGSPAAPAVTWTATWLRRAGARAWSPTSRSYASKWRSREREWPFLDDMAIADCIEAGDCDEGRSAGAVGRTPSNLASPTS